MFSLDIRPKRFFALGVAFTLSLTFLLVMLVVIAYAQGDASRAWQSSESETEKSVLQDGVVRVEPAVTVVENGETFRVYVMIDDAVNLGGFQFVIDYDPAIIEVPKQPNPMVLGAFLGSTGRTLTEFKNDIDPVTGVITYVVFTTGSDPGPNGDGVLAFVDLSARALGTTALDLREVEVADIGGTPQDISIGDGLVVVASSPDPAQVSIHKSAESSTAVPQGLLTYRLQRNFSLAGDGHTYDEIVFDPIPSGATYLAGSATLNGLPAPQLYTTTLDAIYFQHRGVFTDTDQWILTFQVQVGSVPSGTLILNTVTETASFDGAAYSGPYTSTSSVTVCTMPAAPSLSSPPDASETDDTTPTFSWVSVGGAISYRIQVDDDSGFSSPAINQTTSSTSYTPGSELPDSDTYYWRVRAFNSCGSGPWSAVWEFAIPAQSPWVAWIYLPAVVRGYP